MKKGTIALFGLTGVVLFAGLLLSGCATAYYTQGSKIDDSLIAKIEKGKTTKSEILKCFGAPDRIIETGTTAESKTAIKGDTNIASQQNIAIGKNQEIYIYEYAESSTEKNIFEASYGVGGRTAKKKNTLMIWIDKDTDIVQDYGYKKEI